MKHTKTLAVTLSAAALVLGGAGPAAAHVTVASSSATGGDHAVLTFKVPVESETARTVGITVRLPTATPFSSVLSRPVPGWKAALTRTTLADPVEDDDGNTITAAVTEVTWTATGGGLAPGEFGEFELSVGPLPSHGTLYLPTLQSYSDGTRTDWVQQAQGGAEPEHPAPSLRITPASSSAASSKTDAAAGPAFGEGDGWGVGLGAAGIVLALAAGAAGGTALSRTRRSAGLRPAADSAVTAPAEAESGAAVSPDTESGTATAPETEARTTAAPAEAESRAAVSPDTESGTATAPETEARAATPPEAESGASLTGTSS